MGREFDGLNIKGLFCYGLKVIVKLIKHFKYDGSKWHEFLLCMSDYTLIDVRNSIGGRYSKHWEMDKYSPNEILEPVVMPSKNVKAFYHVTPADRQSGFSSNLKMNVSVLTSKTAAM